MSTEPERERIDYDLLTALRRGDEGFVRKFFPEDSLVGGDHAVDVERPDAENVTDRARTCRSWRGVTVGGNSALHIAAGCGHLELAELICAKDDSLLAARNIAAGETPLHCAARAGASRIVSHFISAAMKSGRKEELLLAKDREGKTALYVAAEEARAAAVRVLMSALPRLATEVDEKGVSPLYVAVLSGSLEVVQILTKSPDTPYGGPNGQTALHAATMIKNPEIAKKLLQWKSTLAKKADNSGSTPLHYLATTFKSHMMCELLKHDTSPAYVLDSNGLCPVHVASRWGRRDMVCELISRCPDMDELVDNKGRNFLHIAVVYNRAEIVNFVCQRPLLMKMMNAKDNEGNTPLHLAVASENHHIMSLLSENKSVHPRIINKDGQTPLNLAVTWLDKSVHRRIIKKDDQTPLDHESVHPSITNKDGQAPLHDEITPKKDDQTPLDHENVHPSITNKDGQALLHDEIIQLEQCLKSIVGKVKAIDQELMCLPDAPYLARQQKDKDKIGHEMERIVDSAAPITTEEEEGEEEEGEEEEEEEEDQTVFGQEGERMDGKLLNALRKRDESFVREVFSPVNEASVNEASVAADHALAIDLPDTDNIACQACRGGVTAGGNSPLHIVATLGHFKLAELICDGDSSLLEARNAALETPLHCAVRARADHRIVSLFISKARRLEEMLRATDREGKTALHAAVEEGGNAKVVRVLVSADPGLVAIVDDYGASPLYAAVLSKSLKVVQILIDLERPAGGGKKAGTTSAGARPKTSYAGSNGQTALHAAAIVQSKEIIGKLLRWKPKLAKKVDNSGNTPLHYAAAATSNTSMVCQLLDHGTSFAYLSNFEGLYPIHIAAGMGTCDIILKLIERCHYMDELVDNRGRNFLHIAAQVGRPMVVKYVCQHRELAKMMNARDNEGNTPLHLAVCSQNQKIVSLLLGNGSVHPSIMNKNGQTPRDLAKIQLGHGLTTMLNPQMWIFYCLQWIGAIFSPQQADRSIYDRLVHKKIAAQDDTKELKKYESTAQNLVIVSALIATVTFAAAFTMPGGNIADDHQNGGTPTLARKYFFTAFVVADFIAFLCSITATIWLSFAGSHAVHRSRRLKHINRSQIFTNVAAQSMMAAFALAVYVVLAPVNILVSLAVCIVAFPSILLSSPHFWQYFRLKMTQMRRQLWSMMCKACLIGRPFGLAIKCFKWFISRLEVRCLLVYVFIFGVSRILSIKHLHFS